MTILRPNFKQAPAIRPLPVDPVQASIVHLERSLDELKDGAESILADIEAVLKREREGGSDV